MTDLSVSDLAAMTVQKALKYLNIGEFSPEELRRAGNRAIESASGLNAFVLSTPDWKSPVGTASGHLPLRGIPVGVKDMFCTQGVRTTAGSRILGDFVPGYESFVTGKLWNTGAVLAGKTNLDEFAMGGSTETSIHGPCVNPWRVGASEGKNKSHWGPKLVPGGSSGGSAAAVAAGLCLGALGTDTGGSIRQPAAFTGIVGIRPTYGRCSRWGVIAYASSLDQSGVFARTVADAAILLEAISGFDPRDSTSVDCANDGFIEALRAPVSSLRVGLPDECHRVGGLSAETDAAWQRAARWLEDAGVNAVPVSLPHTDDALAAYYIIAPAEASSNLARYDGVRYGRRVPSDTLETMLCQTRGQGFGAEVRRRILIGNYVLSTGYYDSYYLQALKVRDAVRRDFDHVFSKVDALLMPVTPGPAFEIGSKKKSDPVAMYKEDIFTVPSNLAGLPGMSIPVGRTSDGLPIGLQLVAPAFQENRLFSLGQTLENAAGKLNLPHPWWLDA